MSTKNTPTNNNNNRTTHRLEVSSTAHIQKIENNSTLLPQNYYQPVPARPVLVLRSNRSVRRDAVEATCALCRYFLKRATNLL